MHARNGWTEENGESEGNVEKEQEEAKIKPLDIELELIAEANVIERELIKNLELEVTPQGHTRLDILLLLLKDKGYRLDGAAISYYSLRAECYISCGLDPLTNCQLDLDELYGNNKLKLRAKLGEGEREPMGMTPSAGPKTETTKKRPKERKISYVIEKVSQWRKLYNGYTNEEGEMIRLSLDDAAIKVGVSKKSLDDYLLQLRLGKKFGFDFQANKDEKVGVLRAFVKNKRREANPENFPGSQPGSSPLAESESFSEVAP